MPIITIEPTRALCPPGEARFVLADVTSKDLPSYSGEGTTERWIWRFISDKRDPETGQHYEVAIFTGLVYGNPKAKLTWLLDLLVPGITKEQADNLDTDTLVQKYYKGSVKHLPGEKDPSKIGATFAYLVPEGAPDDPFAGPSPGDSTQDPELGRAACQWKDCHKLLTEAEIKGCRKHFGDDVRVCTEHGKKQKELILQVEAEARIAAAEVEDADPFVAEP